MDNINLKRKVTLKRKSDIPEQTTSTKKPNTLIWLVIIVLVAVGGFFVLKQINQDNTSEIAPEEVVLSVDSSNNQNTAESGSVTSNDEEINSAGEDAVSNQNEVSNPTTETNSASITENTATTESNSPEVASESKEPASNDAPGNNGNQSSAIAVQGSVEEKANQVIRGVFGNGSERKQALGVEYEVIQSKVNEIYKKSSKN